MPDREQRQGFFERTIRAWGWLLGIAWLLIVVTGIALILPPPGRYPPIIGWLLLLVAAIVFFATMDRWVKTFAGLIFLAALRSCSTIFLGHVPERPEKSIPTWNAVVMTAFLVGSAFLVFSLAERRLKTHDRVALFAFTCCLFWGMADEARTMFAITVGFGFLMSVWCYDHLRGRRDDVRKPEEAHRQPHF